MYLYFDKKGVLKEIINDEALRQGNYNVNTIYVYVDNVNYDSIDASYLLPSSLIVGPMNYDEFTDPEDPDDTECFIPFNPKRDLKFFQYNKAYKFCKIDLEEDLNDNSPLDEAGTVHCELLLNLNGTSLLQLGDVNFNVEVNAVLNEKQVGTQQYLSLSDYQFLRSLVSGVSHDKIDKIDSIIVYQTTPSQETLSLLEDDQLFYVVSTGDLYKKTASSPYYSLVEANYIHKVSSNSVVYGTDGSGNQTTITYSAADAGNGTLVMRGSAGNITVPLSPIATSSATSKSYVDSNFVGLTGTQVITGMKSFTSKAIFSDANLYNGYLTTNSKNYFVRVGVTSGQYVTYKLPSNYSDVGAISLTLATEEYVTNVVSTLKANSFQVVDSLPAAGQEGIIYLVETSSGVYEQYIWEGSDYIDLGTTQLDLSGFVQKTQTIAGIDLQDNITSQELTNALVFASNDDIDGLFA